MKDFGNQPRKSSLPGLLPWPLERRVGNTLLRTIYDQWESHPLRMPPLDHWGNLGNQFRLSDECLEGKHEKMNSSLYTFK